MTTTASNPVRFKPGRNPNSLKNLIPYKPGQNGHGRVYSLANRLKHALDKPLTEPKEDAPVGERIVYKTLTGAIDLVPVAFREVWDRTEGPVGKGILPIQDNRQYTIIIQGDDAKKKLEQLLQGKVPELEAPVIEQAEEPREID